MALYLKFREDAGLRYQITLRKSSKKALTNLKQAMKRLLFLSFYLVVISRIAFAQSITLAPANPVNPAKGTLNYDNATNLLRYWNGSAWVSLTNTAPGTEWVQNGNDINNSNTGNVGIGTSTPGATLNVGIGKTVIFGNASGPGTKLVWYGSKAAFRAGYNFMNEFDEANAGTYSIGLGAAPVASGTNSVAIGSNTLASGESAIALGTNANAIGNNSVALGTNANASGSNSVALGNDVTANGNYSMAIGTKASTNTHVNSFCINGSSNNQTASNTSDNQMMMRFDNYTFWISPSNYAYLTPASNGWAYTSDRHKKENFQLIDGENVLKKIAGIPFYSWNFKAKEASQYRHYGIMAQDFYEAFGKDNYGEIGNDTTVSPLDLLGVAYSGIKALEKRTEVLQMQNQQLIEALASQNEQFTEEIAALKAIIQPKRRRIIAYKSKALISETALAKK